LHFFGQNNVTAAIRDGVGTTRNVTHVEQFSELISRIGFAFDERIP
jgi:hypothetical protein